MRKSHLAALLLLLALASWKLLAGMRPPEALPASPPGESARASGQPGQGSPPAQPRETEHSAPAVVPILMYHEVGTPSGPWKDLYVEPEVLARQLDWLQDNGYTTVSLRDVYGYWHEQKPAPARPVVLTFDDGYPSAYRTVWPLLRERGMRATFFLYPAKLNTSRGLTGAMVEDMARSGMEIGSHTYDHADLRAVSSRQWKRQLADSRLALEKIAGRPVQFLAYPAGKYTPQVIEAAKGYGYLGAVTTEPGRATPDQDAFAWSRIRVGHGDGVQGLARKLEASTIN